MTGLFRRQPALLAAAFIVCAAVAVPSRAQDHRANRIEEVIRPDLREAFRRADKSVSVRTRRAGDERIDTDSGVLRAVYSISSHASPAATPVAAARGYLSSMSKQFGLDGSGQLEVVSVRSTAVSHHIQFQQYVDGMPVYGRYVKVNLDALLQPTMAMNGIAPGLERAVLSVPKVSPAAATEVVRSIVVEGEVQTSEPELMVYPSDPPVPVWRMLAWPSSAPGEWEVLVDAVTSKVVQILDRTSDRVRLKATGDAYSRSVLEPTGYAVVQMVDGSGLAFDPDPLTTSGAAYAPPYTDNGDAGTPELDAERVQVDLRDISMDNEGLYRLDGPYVRIVGGGSLSFQPPGEAGPTDFRYSRSEPGFEAVCAYYHLDRNQRYVQSLGFTDLQNGPIRVNPRASGLDNSFYTPGQNTLEFGTGGVDDAEDAGVLLHEYGHALLEAGAPGLSIDGEGQALHEGWADFWAGSYMRFLAESQTGKRTDWENVFRWDSGDGHIWPGRSLTKVGVYPNDTTCDDPNDANGDGCLIHSDGLLWATTLMEIYSDVGKSVIDRLVLQSHAYLSPPVTFMDAAEAVVQADRDLYGGLHTSAIIERLSNRGLLDASSFGPVVSHEPLRSTEELGQSVTVTVGAIASSAPVQTVSVQYRSQGESDFTTLVLSPAGGDDYSGDMDLPLLPSTIEYYVEAVDGNSIHSRLPANAPATLFEFEVGPDTEDPVISHIPISSASSALWPIPVVASVDDNLGVDSVWVNFTIEDGEGTVYEIGSFGLSPTGDEYRASFPLDASELRIGSYVRYSITAVDASVASNRTDAPSSGTYSFPIVFSGILAGFDFEQSSAALTPTGVWERGTPAATLLTAHSGTGAWGTDLDGSYPGFGQLSTLSLPQFNLAGLAKAYLVFWHWYDFEYRGSVQPGEPVDGSIWDGGNVKLSTDGGATWTVLEPESGYSGVVASSATNPLAGQPAFGGYSFGWRREIIELPAQNGMFVRFDFGTDESNLEESIGYAGWFIDDVSLLTDRPVDQSAPELVELPPKLTLKAVGQSLPSVEARITDNTGVASVFVDYVIAGSTSASGSLPLAMSFDDLTKFSGELPGGMSFQAGDRFAYRLRAIDFDGNETVGPLPSQDPLAIEFRSVAGTNALHDVVATGQWIGGGGTWRTQSAQTFDLVSSLVLPPATLADDVADVWLQLEHSYELGEGIGGNVSFSVDDGQTWAVLEPETAYPSVLMSEGHPMNDAPVFSGSSGGPTTTLFDLSEYAGKLVHLRFDFGATRAVDAAERWTISDAYLFASSLKPEIEIPHELSLSSNFPDPFSSTTTISFTLPETMRVRIDVVNTLGQLVGLLANGMYDGGTHTLTFDGSRLASGLYIVVMDAGSHRRTERMMIVH